MTEAIKQLYQSEEVNTCLRVHFKEQWQDVKQDVFETLLSLPAERLDAIKSLRHYVLQIIINLRRNKYAKPAKLYTTFEELPDIGNWEHEPYNEDEYKQQIDSIQTLSWYHRGILDLYVELGSVRAVSEKTKIPFDSVKFAIKEARQQCKQQSHKQEY